MSHVRPMSHSVGGKREGAGRPPKDGKAPAVSRTYSIPQEIDVYVRGRADELGVPMSEVVTEILRRSMRAWESKR